MTGNGGNGTGYSGKSEGRSPSWPAIPLDEALEQARKIYEAEKRHATTKEVMYQHWGYSPKSSGARQVAAALRSFGLIESAGDNWKITDTAWRIIVDPDQSSEARREFIRALALKPKIHSELWKKYKDELPSEPTLKSFLIFEKGFNKSGVDDFIKQYKRTIEFAELSDKYSERLDGDFTQGGDLLEEAPENSNDRVSPAPSSTISLPKDDEAIFAMTLPRGNMLEIRLKKKLSSEEYDLIFDTNFFKLAKYSLANSEDF